MIIKTEVPFLCNKCKKELGETENNWKKFQYPLICPNCSKDNTQEFFTWISKK